MAIRDIKKLDDLMDGAATERFNNSLAEVMRNVFDPNTDPEKKRSVSLVFTFLPNKRRDTAVLKMDVKTVLAQPVPVDQMIMLHITDMGEVVAQEYTDQIPGQKDFDGGEINPKVAKFTTRN